MGYTWLQWHGAHLIAVAWGTSDCGGMRHTWFRWHGAHLIAVAWGTPNCGCGFLNHCYKPLHQSLFSTLRCHQILQCACAFEDIYRTLSSIYNGPFLFQNRSFSCWLFSQKDTIIDICQDPKDAPLIVGNRFKPFWYVSGRIGYASKLNLSQQCYQFLAKKKQTQKALSTVLLIYTSPVIRVSPPPSRYDQFHYLHRNEESLGQAYKYMNISTQKFHFIICWHSYCFQ